MMAILLALAATLLTSWLPIVTKQMLHTARPALVAWSINAFSLPILATGTLFVTGVSVPHVDGVFVLALGGTALLNWTATILSTRSLAQADASLVTPLLTFNPIVTFLIAWGALGEVPGVREGVGVVVILLGAYLLQVEEARTTVLAPLTLLLRRPETLLALVASVLWGITTVLEKVAIEHVRPPNGPLVALLGTGIMVLLLTPGALVTHQQGGRPMASSTTRWPYWRSLALAVIIAGIAPLFGFTAIAVGHVGAVTALFKLSAVFTLLWARLFLNEGHIRQRLLGAIIMVLGGTLIAV